jgi:hypothetical protein
VVSSVLDSDPVGSAFDLGPGSGSALKTRIRVPDPDVSQISLESQNLLIDNKYFNSQKEMTMYFILFYFHLGVQYKNRLILVGI